MKNKFKVSSLAPYIDMTGLTGDEIVERKGMQLDVVNTTMEIKEGDERTVIARISAPTVDADGDIVIPMGCDTRRFVKNNVIMVDHDYKVESCVGNADSLEIKPDGIYAKIRFADTEKALDVWKLVKGNFIHANSIGFIVRNAILKGTKEFKDFCNKNRIEVIDGLNRIITEYELVESSIVAIPSCPDALIQAISLKSITLSDKTIKQLKIETPTETPTETPKTELEKIKEQLQSISELLVSINKPKEEVVIEVEPVAPVIEPIKEEVKPVIEPIEPIEPIVEQVEQVEPIDVIDETITIIRLGDYDLEAELELAKAIKNGKII